MGFDDLIANATDAFLDAFAEEETVTLIDPDGTTNPNGGFRIVGGDDVTITGCTLHNIDITMFNIDAGNSIVITGNKLGATEEGATLADIEDGVTDVIISNNVIEESKEANIGGDRCFVIGNIFKSLWAGEAYAVDYESTAVDGICAYNFCDSTEYSTGFCDTTDATNITVADNLN